LKYTFAFLSTNVERGQEKMAIAYFPSSGAQNPQPANNKPLRIISLKGQVKIK